MPVGVIIVAAGRGERLGGDIPKQLLRLGRHSMLRWSVAAFDREPEIAELVVVLPSEFVEKGASLVGDTTHTCRVVAGGPRRQDSVRLGLDALSPDIDLVLVHDAARPFVDSAVIGRVLEGVRADGVAVPAVPARDTVKRVPPGAGAVAETIPRQEIWLAQTPQGFRRAVLEAAVALGSGERTATDEAMLAEQAGHAVRIVKGDDRNVKITTPDDLRTARVRVSPLPRVGTGYDLHRLVDGRPLVFAGVVVAPERGPAAHSDGDVVCHAIVDAMLGAAGAGDIGRHFPDTDPRWAGAAGLELLARARAIVDAAGLRPANVDVTVVLERPKLAPFVDAIRARLSEALGIAIDHIGLKAKTNEGLDAVGRGEAIAAHAVAVLDEGPAA
jgi:2-C-methyl-D-erythritol 4-phosphate cytidylyltransferase/2-C-methyl-D-erythritol 2,4-cyclodiphosphate synthase